MKAHALALIGVLTSIVTPTNAFAQSEQALHGKRFVPYAGLAAGGHGRDRDSDFPDTARALMGPGGHLGGRIEAPVSNFFSIGGLFEFGATTLSCCAINNLHIDASFWMKGRYVIDLNPFDLEVYGGVPIGLSTVFLDSNLGINDNRVFGMGFNSGLLFGAQFLFERGGFFGEMGGRFRRTWHRQRDDIFDEVDRWNWGTRQFNMNFGGVLYF